MGRQAGRGPEETRLSVLDAAAHEFRAHGLQASLDRIAASAGVSKGGLKYHFASKDDLVLALARHLLEGFRENVRARLDPADTRPGALARAYISARTSIDPAIALQHQDLVLITMLSTVPVVQDLALADSAQWDHDLAQDGLPPHVYEVAIAAADGASCAAAWGSLTDDGALDRLRGYLIDLTLDAG